MGLRAETAQQAVPVSFSWARLGPAFKLRPLEPMVGVRMPCSATIHAILNLATSLNRASGRAPTTVGWYQARLGMFLRYLGEGSSLADLTVDAVRG